MVAKGQRKEKPTKIEQRKVWGLEWGLQVKQTALLARPVYTGQAQGEEKKHIKRGAKTEPGTLFSLHLLGWPTLMPQGCIFLCLPIKLSCNTACVHHLKFLLQWDRTEESINSPNIHMSWGVWFLFDATTPSNVCFFFFFTKTVAELFFRKVVLRIIMCERHEKERLRLERPIQAICGNPGYIVQKF